MLHLPGGRLRRGSPVSATRQTAVTPRRDASSIRGRRWPKRPQSGFLRPTVGYYHSVKLSKLLSSLLIAAAALACGPVPKKGKTGSNAQAIDDWREALWPHVTATASGGQNAQCEQALVSLESESRCQGTICRFGAELASQWLTKCDTIAPDSVARVTELQTKLRSELSQPRSDCGAELEQLFGDICKSGACPVSVQDWATRCGETEAGPLALALVQRAFASPGDSEGSPLDASSCATLRDKLHQAASCAAGPACQEAWSNVEVYRKRCEYGGMPPELATGINQLLIAYGAGRLDEVVTLPAKSKLIYAGQFPLTLADGKGVILGVCGQRPLKAKAYLEARAACQGGTVDVIRMVGTPDQRQQLQLGSIPLPTPLPITQLYPWLFVVDERMHEDDRALPSLRGALDALSTVPKADAVAKLVALFDTHAGVIAGSYDAQQVVRKKDAALVRSFERLAKAKLAGAPRRSDVANRWGMVHRAKRRPFADMALSGKLSLGAATRAHFLDLADVLPKSMAAYHQVLGHLSRQVKFGKRPTAAQLGLAKEFGDQRARACRGLLIKLRQTEQDLLICTLKREGCTAKTRQALGHRWKKTRDAAAEEHHQLDIALSIVAGGDDKLAQLMTTSGCLLP